MTVLAFGGSNGSSLADTFVTDLGPTGQPFTNLKNGGPARGGALMCAAAAGRRQVHEIVTRLCGEADERQLAGSPQVVTHLNVAPGTSACTALAT